MALSVCLHRNQHIFITYCVHFVFKRYGHFSGINRKIQLKYLGKVKDSSESSGGEEKQSKQTSTDSESEKSLKVKEKDSKEEEALLLIMKWGGELTQAGRVQAEDLGKAFRLVNLGHGVAVIAPPLGPWIPRHPHV